QKKMSLFKNESEPDYEVDNDNNFLAKLAVRPLVATNCTDFVVAHSNIALNPVRKLSEVSLMPHILETMHKLGLNRLLRVQSHTWRHLLVDRGHGAMVVAAPRSGRTLSYIPPVCDVVSRAILEAKKVKLNQLSESPLLGALAVILVPDLERVSHVSALCNAFLRRISHDEGYTLILNVPSTENPDFFRRLFNGVGCLVTTPAQLVWIWRNVQNLLQFKHLKVIVYDDIDLMDQEMLAKAEEVLRKLIPMNRSHPQLVMISQSYDSVQMSKLKLLNSNPALIFGDLLEAALYGETRLQIALRPALDKVDEVIKLLKQRPPKDYRTVIFCSDDKDMQCLVYLLQEYSYSCLPYYQDANLEVAEEVHSWLSETRGIILLTTDNCPELSIRKAHTLIHYSMSRSWGRFKMRYLALAGNLSNKLDQDPSRRETESLQLHSLVLLDDSNQMQLPRLVDFARKHQKVDDNLVAISKLIRKESAKLNPNRNVACGQILMMGNCITSSCEERHQADLIDQPSASVPTSGDVKLLLVRVYSPTHFCVHLLEHLPPGQSWKAYPSLPVQHMRLQLLQGCNNERYWPPVAGDVCLCRLEAHKIRVRVLKVSPIENVNLAVQNLSVLVQSMDEDTRIFSVKSGRLYVCSKELQAEPPLALDLRLFGLVPQSGERSWSEEDRKGIEFKLRNLPKECFLQASVEFSTSHTIFARNLMGISYASGMRLHVRRLDLCQHLTEAKLAKSSQQAKDKIRNFFEGVTGTDPGEEKHEKLRVKKVQKEEQIEEQLEEQLEENNNNLPAKPVLKKRAQSMIQMGLELAKLNREQKVKEQDLEEAAEMVKKLEQKAKQPQEQSLSNEGLQQLMQCINNIAALELEDGKTMAKLQHREMLLGASKLLDHMETGKVTSETRKRKRKEAKYQSEFKVTPPPRQPQLISSVMRPSTSYYQTLTTLELHVLLPDDSYEYAALLSSNQLFFHASHSSLEPSVHQFILSLGLPYSSLKHFMRGRTVYMSLKKTVAMLDPLNFHLYHRFLKPNLDKFGQQDVRDEEQQVEKFTKYGQQMVLNESEYKDQEDNEDSADEDLNLDGIERGDNHNQYED
ncbi:hypothetical protein KR054_003878, partial [Drosophila jambulina]